MRAHSQPQRQRPIGVRGAAAGPRTDLAQADTSHARHTLYVKVVPARAEDPTSYDLTLDVLKYVHSRLPQFREMGIAVVVEKLSKALLADARLKAALKRRGVTHLPALVTGVNVYLGPEEIKDVYERNLKEFMAYGRREEAAPEGAELGRDDLGSYYAEEMTFERAEDDTEEAGIGETAGMMDQYRAMMERREAMAAARKPYRVSATAQPRPTTLEREKPSDGRRASPPRARRSPPKARPQRAASPPRATDPDSAGIEDTIDRLTRDIDSSMRDRAFAAQGGDSYEDDGGDPQDDLMESAFWSRNAETAI